MRILAGDESFQESKIFFAGIKNRINLPTLLNKKQDYEQS
jgi:hypothetical protein